MRPDARFFFTFHPGEAHRQRSHTDFEYPDSFFADLASKHGFDISDFSEAYAHPRGQRMKSIQISAEQ